MLPPGVNEKDFAGALAQFREVVGTEWVFTTEDDLYLYRDAYSPFWGEPEEILASGAVAPSSVEEVSKVVKIANTHRIPIYTISTGKNLGYGGSAPNLSGSVVLDLKRMNRVIEVDDRRHFAIVEPGVAYFDLYRYIQDRGLKVWIDPPDPGWGSPVGNSLEHGVGYGYGPCRDHFWAHCGMEVVLANGEIVRTGMGALPNAKTWAEYRYGVGPYVDGLFGQGNFGVVTKMGFHLVPAHEAYMTGTVSVPKRNDIVPLIDGVNALEHAGTIGMPEYRSPLGGFGAPPDAVLATLLNRPDGPDIAGLETYAQQNKRGFYSCQLQFYGSAKVIQAQWEYAQELFGKIPGATFEPGELLRFPITPEQADRAHKVAIGIPNLSVFGGGRPGDGHVWFSPVLPKSGEAVMEAQQAFTQAFRDIGVPPAVSVLSMPATWMYRAFVFLMGFPAYRGDVEKNRKTREVMKHLIEVATMHGWGEYRTPPAFQEQVVGAYSYNNYSLRHFVETLKDAADPNGILSAGRYGIWPKHIRETKA